MRRILSFLTAAAIMVMTMLCFTVTASAKTYRAVLEDNGDCFATSEEQDVLELLKEAAQKAKCNLAIVTEDNFAGTTPGSYALDKLDTLFGEYSDSLILVISTDFENPDAYDFIDMSGDAFSKYYSDLDNIYAAYYSGKDMGGYYDGIKTFCEYFTNGGKVSVSYKVVLSDYDDVLTSAEQTLLLDVMQDAADDIECNIGVVITSDRGGEIPESYADAFADDNFGYGSNNIVLLFDNDKVSPKHQDWISTMGLATEMYDHQTDAIFDYLYAGFDSNGGDNYYAAIQYFCSYLRNNQDGGWTYNSDEDYYYYYDDDVVEFTLVALTVPLIIAGIVTAIATSSTVKKYSKKAPVSARRYIDTSRTRFTQRQDIYLRETTTHVRISSSSGGGSHGGRGGGGGRSGGGRGGGGGRSR